MSDDEFDLDAWIAGAKLPERTVTVYGRGDLVAEAEQLRTEAAEVERTRDPERMNNATATNLRRRIEEVSAQFESSKLTVRLRALPIEEYRSIGESLGKGTTDEDATYAYIAAQVASPPMTVAQVKALRGRIGEGQWMALIDAANGVMNDRRLDVPFSSATSGLGRISS